MKYRPVWTFRNVPSISSSTIQVKEGILHSNGHLLRAGPASEHLQSSQFADSPTLSSTNHDTRCLTELRTELYCDFAKLRRATIRFAMSVRPSVRMKHLGSQWTEFHEI